MEDRMHYFHQVFSPNALFMLFRYMQHGFSTNQHSSILHDILADLNCELETVKNALDTADIKARNKYGYTPLHVALLNPNCKLEIIRLLIRQGADVNAVNYLRETSLHIAVQNTNCKLEVIKTLLFYGAKVDALDADSNTPLHSAARNPNFSMPILNLLCNGLSSLTERNHFNDTPLLTALKNPNCSIDIVKMLMCESTLNDLNSERLSPLQIYLQNPNCNVEVVRYLINCGSHISQKYPDKSSLLHGIVKTSNCYTILSEVLHYLSTTINPDDRIDINCTDITRNTPLHTALEFKPTDPKVISLLLKYGANASVVNCGGETPLYKALHFDYNLTIIKELIKYGANILEATGNRDSPLNILLKKYERNPTHFLPCVELLLKYSVKKCFEDHDMEPDFQGHELEIFLCSDIIYTECGKVVSKLIDACCRELVRMRRDLLKSNFSLYDFISSKNCKPSGISESIVIVFTYNNYPNYYDIIVDLLDDTELLAILKKLRFYSTYPAKDNFRKGKQIALNAECLGNIVLYLSKRDLLSLIIAFYVSL